MPEPHRRLRDPRELQALAHPVRMGIIELLSISGPLTATQLADLLDETPANCSWHLRKLAKFGFVEEAEGGTGRQRPWRVPGLGLMWSDEGGASAEERRAAAALAQVTMGRAMDRLFQAGAREPDEPEEWRRAQMSGEYVAWVTAEELAQMNADIVEVLYRYADRLTKPETRPEGARLCEFVAWGVPTYFREAEPS
jgi:DNA-binding transcriptional ArsR family regulator